ncbi:MAG: hypothetical protein NC489_09040 [Ruminococcus flavefaciens]|nr:hypothetical protein [Ruminococcus flavefaciens]
MSLHDSLRIIDTLHDKSGKLLAKSNGHAIIGEVEKVYKSKRTGKVIFTRTIDQNDLLVTGAVYLSEKINNVRSTFLTTPVDVSLGVHTAEEIDFSAATIPQEIVCGIMVGCGGCGDTYNTVHKVHRTDYTVPSPVPFRVVPLSQDIKGATRDRYFLRVVRGNYAYYYGKKFTVNRDINVMYEDGTTVPTNVNIIGDVKGQYIKTFTKYEVTVDETDIREGFKLTMGNTLQSRINSVGLVTGYPGIASDSADKGSDILEFFNVRTMTTLNTENDELKDSESTVSYIYRLYFV